MKLPESFTTVTSLSKTIAIYLFVSLPFTGFYFGVKYQKQISQQSEQVNCPSVSYTALTTPTVIPTVTNTLATVTPILTPSDKFAPFIKKLAIILKNNEKIENYYTPFWFWCGGSNGDRILSKDYSSYLSAIGKTSDGKVVYILNNNAPYPQDQHLIPSIKKSMKYDGENGEFVSEQGWSEFLSNQSPDYPMLIIKDSLGKMEFYFRQDYLYLPGC